MTEDEMRRKEYERNLITAVLNDFKIVLAADPAKMTIFFELSKSLAMPICVTLAYGDSDKVGLQIDRILQTTMQREGVFADMCSMLSSVCSRILTGEDELKVLATGLARGVYGYSINVPGLMKKYRENGECVKDVVGHFIAKPWLMVYRMLELFNFDYRANRKINKGGVTGVGATVS